MQKVRYAVVGAGWIAQDAFMPSVRQTGNSVMSAIVTGDTAKGRKLADLYGISHVYSYERYDEMLASGQVDAVYIALPNSLHADFAIRAAKAGIHVLVEKPLATTIEDSLAMIAAADSAGVWLMTAYRLHNEPATVEVLDMVRRGEIGEPRLIQAVLAFQTDAANHRLKAEHWGGPLQDLGVYCINAARHIFADEPVEAIAMTDSLPDDPRFAEVEEAIGAILRFPRGRMASFFSSFGTGFSEGCRIIGTKAEIHMDFAFRFETAKSIRVVKDQEVSEKKFPGVDNFSGQTAYFSDCILKGERPEPDGEEGLADMRAMLAIEAAARTGKPQKISSPARSRHPDQSMVRRFPPTAAKTSG
jgi:predicted dehydrogenase